MMLRPALLLVLAAIGLFAYLELPAGGGEGAVADAATSTAVVVRYDQTGGFAGIDLHVTVHADRRVTVSRRVGGRGVVRRHAVKAATLAKLRRTLDAAHVERPVKAVPTGCADCFNYAIRYRSHRLAFDDVSVPGRARAALAELQRIGEGGR